MVIGQERVYRVYINAFVRIFLVPIVATCRTRDVNRLRTRVIVGMVKFLSGLPLNYLEGVSTVGGL